MAAVQCTVSPGAGSSGPALIGPTLRLSIWKLPEKSACAAAGGMTKRKARRPVPGTENRRSLQMCVSGSGMFARSEVKSPTSSGFAPVSVCPEGE